MDFARPVAHRGKMKENQKKYEDVYLARKLKMHWNLKVTVIQFYNCHALKYTQRLGIEELEIEEWAETI